MRRHQTTLFSVAIGLLLIVGAFTFHRIAEPNRICLAWEGLSELSFENQNIPACDSVSRLQRPMAPEQVREWTRRLNFLDRLSWLKETSLPISVRIDEKNPHAFHFDNRLVTIGTALVAKPGQLEHAALLGWVKTNWSEQSDSTQEVMADILTWLALGDASWSDPIQDHTVNPASYLRYSLTSFSRKNYCVSPFRSLEDLQICDLPNGEIPASHALRPLVSWTIWSFVKDLASSTQIEFFKALLSNHFDENFALEESASLNHQNWAKEKIMSLLKKWNLGDQLDRRELTRALYRADLHEPLSFDLTVEVNGPILEDRVLDSLKNWSKFYPHAKVLFVAHHKKIVLPENVAVDFNSAELETRHYVLLACGWPKAEDAFSPKNHAFSAYQICADDKLPSWTEILSSRPSTLESRAALTPELHF